MRKLYCLIFLGLICAASAQSQNGVLYNPSTLGVSPNGLVMTNLTVSGLTNVTLNASALAGTDANKRMTSLVVGSGLSLSGGTLSATGGGGGGAPIGTMVSDGTGFAVNRIPKASDSTGTNFSVSALTENAGALTGAKSMTLAAGTITTTQPLLVTQTWNAGGTDFRGIALDLVNTASSGSSYPVQVTVGGVSKWRMDVNGAVTASGAMVLNNDFQANGSVRGQYVFADYYQRIGVSGTSVRIYPSGSEDGVATLQNDSNATIAFLGQGRYSLAKTADYSVPYTDASKLIHNDGTAAQRTMTLPSATLAGAVGGTFTFAILNANGIKIACAGSDQIRIGASISTATTGYVDDTTVGDVITITCVKAGLWLATSSVGTGWTTH